ncbi:MAG: lipocalin family protein [Saprospiraceae bacterium]|nr:lipocalin family protein [Saprospiraceae bacterium]
MRLLFFAIISCLGVSFISMKNTHPQTASEITEATHSEILVNINHLADVRGWKLEKIVSNKPCDMNQDGIKSTDIMSEMPSCALDDILFIDRNSDNAYYKRGKLCGKEPKNNTYTWQLVGTKLILSQNGYDDEMEILAVDDTKMVVLVKMEALGEGYHFMTTFKH